MSDRSPWQPDAETWLANLAKTGNNYLTIEVSTDITDVIDRTRELLHKKLGTTPENIAITIVGSNALLLRIKDFEPPDPFED